MGRMAQALAGLVLVLLGTGVGSAAPRIREQAGTRSVEGRTFTATVASDGCLTSLRAGGCELLAAGVGISRGGYLFQSGVVPLPEVTQPRRDGIVAQGDAATVRYQFEDDGVTIEVRNRTVLAMHWFLVLAAEVRGVRLGQDALGRAPRATTDARGQWFAPGARLTVKDAATGWGPWEGRHQVIDLSVAPGAEARLSLQVTPTTDAEREALERLLAPPPEPDLVVLAPQPWQVVQRDAEGGADVTVRVRSRLPGVDALEVRAVASQRGTSGSWTPLVPTAAGTSHAARLRLGQGAGWRLEVRARAAGVDLAQVNVEPVGVGEVFVVAGQSNSTNCGEELRRPATGKVSTFDGRAWRSADDPQPGCHDRSTGGSPWPAFGDLLVERLGVPVGVASTGHAGTSISAWSPDGDLFAWMLARMHALGADGFRALLWHQGESDVGMRTLEYENRLLEVIRATRTGAGWDVPWFLARVSYHSPKQPRFPSTRAAQERLIASGEALRGPDTDTLVGDMRDGGGQGIHFSAKGLDAHGKLWALHVLEWLEPLLARKGR
jgi:eukaryotic-like serine/threonine-protein kinase